MALEAATPQQKPSIATCVRRISYLTFPPNVMTLHRRLFDLYGEGASVDVKEERQRLRQEANQLYVENRSLAAKAISLMPNIDILVWADPFSLDSNFFQQISRSKVQHLKLGKTFIDEPWSLEPPLTPTTWLLRSLHLDVTLSSSYSIPAGSDSNQLMSNFYSSLFRLCSPALESLRWADSDDSPGPMGPLSLGSNLLSFPRLRDLQLEDVDLDNAGLSTLLSSPLRSLKISGPVWDRLDARRLAHGPLRDLESFIVPRLCIHEHQEARDDEAHLDRYIIPVLENHSFSNLRTLSLALGEGSDDTEMLPHDARVPRTALRAIGRLVSLEQLALSAGLTDGYKSQWLVDHDELRGCLGNLKRLRKLAIVQDTYPIPEPGFDVEMYYERAGEPDGTTKGVAVDCAYGPMHGISVGDLWTWSRA
ncbi:hypothetical protein NW759_012094 [Fusarium solani]|nr:hypothetical protein NW759_012094 [Fusarium solani]